MIEHFSGQARSGKRWLYIYDLITDLNEGKFELRPGDKLVVVSKTLHYEPDAPKLPPDNLLKFPQKRKS